MIMRTKKESRKTWQTMNDVAFSFLLFRRSLLCHEFHRPHLHRQLRPERSWWLTILILIFVSCLELSFVSSLNVLVHLVCRKDHCQRHRHRHHLLFLLSFLLFFLHSLAFPGFRLAITACAFLGFVLLFLFLPVRSKCQHSADTKCEATEVRIQNKGEAESGEDN